MLISFLSLVLRGFVTSRLMVIITGGIIVLFDVEKYVLQCSKLVGFQYRE